MLNKNLENSKIFSNLNKEEYREFYIEGEFNVLGLEGLKNKGINRIFPHFEDYKEDDLPREIWIYSTPLAKIKISTDSESHLHKVGIQLKYLSKKSSENLENFEKLKQLLETKLGGILKNPEELQKEKAQGLVNKISSN